MNRKKTKNIKRPVKRNKKLIKRRRNVRKSLPAANGRSVPRFINSIKMSGTSAIIEGCDLVYSIPSTLEFQNQTTDVITIIPSNPAYWTGTRIASIASGYQNYRPVTFQVHYVPQCAVTQQGNVIAGTLWNQAPSVDNLQQTLKTSNGGILTQCYKPAVSNIRLGTNLQYNLYRMGGAINQQSMPFIFVGLQIACLNNDNKKIVPGYFYVKYKYIFKNPIGSGNTFRNLGIKMIDDIPDYMNNMTGYLINTWTTNGLSMGVGTRIEIELNDQGNLQYFYNGTELVLEPDQHVPAWLFMNQDSQNAVNNDAPIPVIKDIIYYDREDYLSTSIIPSHTVYILKVVTQNKYTIFVNSTSSSQNVGIQFGSVYVSSNINQNFGEYSGTTSNVGMFRAVTSKFELVKQSDSISTITKRLEE